MKALIQAIVIASALAAPALAFAQEAQPLTREQVRNELKELERAGYNPMDYYYMESLQAAKEKIAREHDRYAQADESRSK